MESTRKKLWWSITKFNSEWTNWTEYLRQRRNILMSINPKEIDELVLI